MKIKRLFQSLKELTGDHVLNLFVLVLLGGKCMLVFELLNARFSLFLFTGVVFLLLVAVELAMIRREVFEFASFLK